MKKININRVAIILSLFVIVSSFIPIVAIRGETYTLVNEHFYIGPQQPEVIAEDTFNITEAVEYIIGIPVSNAIGSRSETNTYYFEMTSSDRVEIYFLDSSEYFPGDTSDYTEFATSWAGIGSPAPTNYVHRIVCDGYITQEFNFTGTSITPYLILYTNQTQAYGEFFWSEGLAETIYTPYYVHSVSSDRDTNDHIHIFYVNASIDAYILSDFQKTTWSANPNERPPSSLASDSGTEAMLEFTASKDSDVHLLIWHDYLHDSVNGSIHWTYEYQRTFGEAYWSLILVIVLLVLTVLTFVFQKQVLPPVVWTMNKLKHYLIDIPWKAIKTFFGWEKVRWSIITFLFGSLGIHRFLKGYWRSGLIYLSPTLLGVIGIVLSVIPTFATVALGTVFLAIGISLMGIIQSFAIVDMVFTIIGKEWIFDK